MWYIMCHVVDVVDYTCGEGVCTVHVPNVVEVFIHVPNVVEVFIHVPNVVNVVEVFIHVPNVMEVFIHVPNVITQNVHPWLG